MSYIEKEKLIKADIASIENRVRHAFNQGYDLGFKDGKGKAKPLEQESTTKNDLGVDLISRSDVLKLMQDNWHNHNGDWAMQESMDDIRALPTVTPIRPKGQWCPQNDDYFDWYECSECGYGSEGEMQYSSEVDVRTNYCPNCGADMREVEE